MATSAELCATLQEASSEPYFYECLFAMSQKPIPSGNAYEAWRQGMAVAMQEGCELYLLGRASTQD